MDKYPHLKQKLFEEILPPVEKVRDNILEGLEFDTVTEFDYL
jgi:cytochrome P450 family 2 subfamily J